MNRQQRKELMALAKIKYRDHPGLFDSLNHAFTLIRREWMREQRALPTEKKRYAMV